MPAPHDTTPKEDRPTSAPLSLTQRSSLLMWESNPSRETMSWVYQLNGKLDVAALGGAIDEVVHAHTVLRVRFVERGGELFQEVLPFRPGVLEVVDLSGHTKADGLAGALRAIESAYPDLSPLAEPALSATLYLVAPKTNVLAIFVAEALVDGESATLVAAELSRAYARRAGKAVPDLELPSLTSYLAYVRDNPVAPSSVERALAYWSSLESVPANAGDWPSVPDQAGATRFFNLDAAAWKAMIESFPALDTMPFVVLSTWCAQSLADVAGARRFLLTSAVSNRSRPQAKGTIGNFVGPMRMEVEVDPDEGFAATSARLVNSLRRGLSASVVPGPLATRMLHPEGPFVPLVPTVSCFYFAEREAPDFVGVRQRRFRLNGGGDVLRVNCTPDDRGGRNFFFLTNAADRARLDGFVRAFRSRMGLDA